MEMCEKIKYLRKKSNLTLEEVGEKVGVGKSTVRKWENGQIANMRRDKIAKLAEALNCSPAYLMGWEDETENSFTPTINEKDEKDISKRLDAMLGDISSNEALMFDGEPLDEESKELLKSSLENALKTAKLIAKQKYTPNKYKK